MTPVALTPEQQALFVAVTAIWPVGHASPFMRSWWDVLALTEKVSRLMENHPLIQPISGYMGLDGGYDRSQLGSVVNPVVDALCALHGIKSKE